MGDRLTLTIPVVKILVAFLAEPDADRYGLDLMRQTGLASGTLYPILARLQNAGWVRAHWEDVDPSAAGRPPRRFYRLTAPGQRSAATAVAELHAQTRGGHPAPHPRTRTAHTVARPAW
ncbi:MAG: PadR family transcriptional regulator, regulatory protein PadR [Micromonosporaceae bacterium]|jgi:DNA-binding PadR family transcriptional regulator|nr:PadR family transcriptional regulator, regulatory protein PadR [Micromonosporaceae bacterium]